MTEETNKLPIFDNDVHNLQMITDHKKALNLTLVHSLLGLSMVHTASTLKTYLFSWALNCAVINMLLNTFVYGSFYIAALMSEIHRS